MRSVGGPAGSWWARACMRERACVRVMLVCVCPGASAAYASAEGASVQLALMLL